MNQNKKTDKKQNHVNEAPKVTAPITNDGPSLKERYELLVRARNFHYENYSKWMTYFYVAIGSIFVAFYTIASKEDALKDKLLFEKAILLLGYVVSILWYWSCKGYYYWNIHFITMVNYYERDLFKWPKEKRVYFVFANKMNQNNYLNPFKGANISTSKVAILFAFIITSFWGTLAVYKIFIQQFELLNYHLVLFLSFAISVLSILIVSIVIPNNLLYSKNDFMDEIIVKQ